MGVFAQNSESFMDSYSSSFDKTFMELLSRRFGTRRIAANLVYNELIQDKEHVHMNSTMWATLTDYVTYLGRSGKAVVEETDRGWFITYIDRDPAAARRAEAAARLRERSGAESARFEDEVEQRAALAYMVAAAAVGGGDGAPSNCLGFSEDGGDGSTGGSAPRLGVNLGALSVHVRAIAVRPSALGDDEEDEEEDYSSGDGGDGRDDNGGTATHSGYSIARPSSIAGASIGTKRSRSDGASAGVAAHNPRVSNLVSIIEEERSAKSKRMLVAAVVVAPPPQVEFVAAPVTRRDDWLLTGIVVKVMDARIGGGTYLRAKGVVTAVENTYGARLQMIDSGDVLLVDAADLETVVPREGGIVRLLAGAHRGALGEVICLRVNGFCADLRLQLTGAIISSVPYEDFTKQTT